MQAQGGPSRAELWDKGQQSTPDSHLNENSRSNQPPKLNKKLFLMPFIGGSIIPFERKHLVELVFLPVCVSGWMRWLWQNEVGEEANFWNVHVKKKEKGVTTINSLSWCTPIIMLTCSDWRVCGVYKKSDPSCTVPGKCSEGLMLRWGRGRLSPLAATDEHIDLPNIHILINKTLPAVKYLKCLIYSH